MRGIVEKLLEDVDEDIRATMMAEAEPETTAEAYAMTIGGQVYSQERPKNWQTLQDPLFFIIQWQELRNENKSRRED